LNPRLLKLRRALDAACYLIAALLAAISLADIYYRCRWEIFFPDEVYNLDPILTFFRTADYTSVSQGNHPFDPCFRAGYSRPGSTASFTSQLGTLYRERLASALVQFGIVTYFAYRLLRSRDVAPRDALVVALGSWTLLILAGCHYLRIINAGELWGFIYLVAAVSWRCVRRAGLRSCGASAPGSPRSRISLHRSVARRSRRRRVDRHGT
jgi:hypothetical protein